MALSDAGVIVIPSPGAVACDVAPPTIQIVATVTGTATYGIDFVSGN